MLLFPRFTLRWLMVAVPFAGLCLTGWIEITRFEESLRVARKRSEAARLLEFETQNNRGQIDHWCVFKVMPRPEAQPLLDQDEPECP
jgi:hypothetical protein